MAGRGGVLYVASKFAVRGVVTALAHELAPDIRVNGVAPGGTVATDLRGLAALGQNERSLGATPEREADVRRRSPLGTALTPADVAASYVYLASDESRGTTGHFLHPDGGANVT
jgi:NAD(P)-dependent dehydrogenase (short-subunit alcohol dehydrogenase family)